MEHRAHFSSTDCSWGHEHKTFIIMFKSKPSKSSVDAVRASTNEEALEILGRDIRSVPRTAPPRQSSSRRQFLRKRVDDQRRIKGSEVQQDLARALAQKLLPGVKSEQTAAERLESVSTLKAITLCITTRSIGFGTATTFLSLIDLHNVPQRGTIYQLYRVSLAIMESKVQVCQRAVTMITGQQDDYFELRNSADFIQLCKTKPILPDPVARTINAIGSVKIYDQQYYVKFAANRFDNNDRFIPQSEHVLFSNLRHTVVALSDDTTPVEIRRRFYNNNPIAGCIWNDNFVLSNPDDIIPAEFSHTDLADDFDDIQRKIDYMAKKVSKYFSDPISFETEGTKAIFVSNNQSGMPVMDRHHKNSF